MWLLSFSPMAYTYTWSNADQTILKREDENSVVVFIPAKEENGDYAEFLKSGETAANYLAPAALPELTAEEKLANVGLTVAELQGLLGL